MQNVINRKIIKVVSPTIHIYFDYHRVILV